MLWCTACGDIAVSFAIVGKPESCVNAHPKKVVEVPDELVHDAIRRLVWELRKTGRVKT